MELDRAMNIFFIHNIHVTGFHFSIVFLKIFE